MRSTGHRFSGRGAEDAAGAARRAGAGARRRGAVAAGDPRPLRLRPARRRPDRRRRRGGQPDPRPAGRPSSSPTSTGAATASSGSAPPARSPPSPSTSSRRRRDSGAPTPTSTPRAARPSSSRRREETWKASGLDENDEPATVAYLERLFADELQGHRLLANRSIWRRFPTVRNARWHSGNVVLLGDAAHTAHFSVGSGTKLAMEDAIALAAALKDGAHRSPRRSRRTRPGGGRRWRASSARPRRASSGSSRRSATTTPSRSSSPSTCSPAASASPTRTCRLRDPALVAQVDRWFAEQAGQAERAPRAARSAALRRCSRPTGSASWCCPTGSWSRRCASTGRRTGCRTTGTWCTSAAARSAAPGW